MDTKDSTPARPSRDTILVSALTQEVARLVRAIEADQRPTTPALRMAADHARQVLYRFSLASVLVTGFVDS